MVSCIYLNSVRIFLKTTHFQCLELINAFDTETKNNVKKVPMKQNYVHPIAMQDLILYTHIYVKRELFYLKY